jgi:hypothetical protein
MEQTRYFYIYNYVQALFFINNGLEVLDIGRGNQKDVYYKFLRDDKSEQVFMEWKKRKYGEKAI